MQEHNQRIMAKDNAQRERFARQKKKMCYKQFFNDCFKNKAEL